MYNQRDIVLIPFPYSDLTGSKQRPALIVSNENINKIGDRICCLVTRKFHIDNIEITEKDFELGKLPFKSFVKSYRIFTINDKIINKKLCTVSKDFHNKILSKINEHLKINSLF